MEMEPVNISTCRACAVRPCIHDWESHARHLDAELDVKAEAVELLEASCNALRAEGYMRDADHLVAENTRLADELAELKAYCNCDERIDISHADALNAIARVREVHVRWRMGCWDDHSRIFQDQVLRALDGSTE